MAGVTPEQHQLPYDTSVGVVLPSVDTHTQAFSSKFFSVVRSYRPRRLILFFFCARGAHPLIALVRRREPRGRAVRRSWHGPMKLEKLV